MGEIYEGVGESLERSPKDGPLTLKNATVVRCHRYMKPLLGGGLSVATPAS